jgi:hypothetical protein
MPWGKGGNKVKEKQKKEVYNRDMIGGLTASTAVLSMGLCKNVFLHPSLIIYFLQLHQ